MLCLFWCSLVTFACLRNLQGCFAVIGWRGQSNDSKVDMKNISYEFTRIHYIITTKQTMLIFYGTYCISMLSCQKGPTGHAYAWQIGPFWQNTLDIQFQQRPHYYHGLTKIGTWISYYINSFIWDVITHNNFNGTLTNPPLHPIVLRGYIITSPCPNPDANLASSCWPKRSQIVTCSRWTIGPMKK